MAKSRIFRHIASDMPTYRPAKAPVPLHLTDIEKVYSLTAYGGIPPHDDVDAFKVPITDDDIVEIS